jgi:hypothetical protein
MMLESIGNTLLDEASAPRQLRAALDNFTHPRPERGLAILLHGWEGSAESNYQLSLLLMLSSSNDVCDNCHHNNA